MFPIQRYQAMEGWIPETDIDGIDDKGKYLADCTNIDIEPGFLKLARLPIEETLNVTIQSYLATGYELLSGTFFSHSTRGDCRFYILWKLSTLSLKFFIEDGGVTTELNPDEVNSDYSVTERPTNINYSLADNQLKVNLNIIATYNNINESGTDKTVKFNLTLVYLQSKTFISSTLERAEGWYLFPRWIGWTFYNVGCTLDNTSNNLRIANASTWTGTETDISLSAGCVDAGTYFDINPASQITFTNIRSVGDITFDPKSGSPSSSYLVEIYDADSILVYSQEITLDGSAVQSFAIDKYYGENMTVRVFNNDSALQAELEILSLGGCQIDYTILVKNIDKQKYRVIYSDAGTVYLPSHKDDAMPMFVFPKECVDWRLDEFELYVKLHEEEIYTYVGTTKTFSDETAVWGCSFEISEITTTTLTFNYSLGATVYVNQIPYYQHDIYAEIFYRNRTYYVKGDEKLYYSHISGTGLAQPDFFPYDEAALFGYMPVDNSEKCLKLAITPLDEVMIYTNKRTWTYVIQQGGNIPYRRIKADNGGMGVFNSQSLIVELGGRTSAEVLIWCDRFSINASGGGINAATDILGSTHKNYWLQKSNTDKDNAIAFYNKATKEYWIQVGSEIMIFELLYNKWKKYVFSSLTIKAFLGYEDSYAYILTTNNKVYKLDPSVGTILDGSFEYHYCTDTYIPDNSNYPYSASELMHKILQELYIGFKKTKSGNNGTGFCTLQIIADEHNVGTPIYFSSLYSLDSCIAPLLIRYKKIKFRITMYSQEMGISEVGYAFSVPDYTPGMGSIGATGFGELTGSEFGVHH